MINIVMFMLLLIVIIPFGIAILRVFTKENFLNPLEQSFLGFGLGAGVLALLILTIGLLGFLYKNLIVGLLCILFLVLLKSIGKYARNMFLWIKDIKFKELLHAEKLLILFLIFMCAFSLIGALAPLLGTDSASYHMQDPKLFIEQHKISHIPYTRESLWPFLVQMLFTLGLMLKGPVLAKLFNFGFGFFAAIGIYCLSRRHLSRLTSLIAISIFVSVPAIFTSINYAYTDLGVIFYVLAAFYSFFIYLESKKLNWFYISAIFCGFLLGIKVTSATVPALIVAFFVFDYVSNKKIDKKIFFAPLAFALISFGVCGVWYIRSWIILGNPIFPFAGYIFGGNGYLEEFLRYHTTSGMGIGITQYLTAPWFITFYPDMFGGESIGIAFLIFLPLIIFIRKPKPFISYLIFAVMMLYTSWFIVYQYTRFLYPAIALMCILVAYIYMHICKKDKIIFRIATLVMILIFSYSVMLIIYHNADAVPVALGLETEDDYLKSHERSYKMAEYINNNLDINAKIFVLEDPHLFYINRYAANAFCFKMDTKSYKFANSPKEFTKYIRSKGFNYILHQKDLTPGRSGVSYSTPEEVFGKRNVELIKEIDFSYKDEKFKYQLWSI